MKIERLSKEDIKELERYVSELMLIGIYNIIEKREDIKKDEDVKDVTMWKYNRTRLFKKLKIKDLDSVYSNLISGRDNFSIKNKNYFKILKALKHEHENIK